MRSMRPDYNVALEDPSLRVDPLRMADGAGQMLPRQLNVSGLMGQTPGYPPAYEPQSLAYAAGEYGYIADSYPAPGPPPLAGEWPAAVGPVPVDDGGLAMPLGEVS
jgi:hypothetical protein